LLAAWACGFGVVGLVLGGAGTSVGDTVTGNQRLQDIFTRMGGRTGLIDAYLASVLGILGLLAAGYAIQATLRLRAEETGGRAEPVLATAVGRLPWAVQLPAVWVLAAIAVGLVGLAPRLAAVAWGALAACLLLGLVGAALQFDQWLMELSPFSHVPKVPGGAVAATPLVALLLVAARPGHRRADRAAPPRPPSVRCHSPAPPARHQESAQDSGRQNRCRARRPHGRICCPGTAEAVRAA
jgi:ABC-2 type transport system permease protein